MTASSRTTGASQPIRSLEDAARALAQAQQVHATAEAELERLAGPYKAARSALHVAREQMESIADGMAAAKQSYAIQQALIAQDITTDDPAVVVVPSLLPGSHPTIYTLTAVASDGTGLYVYTPRQSSRYDGKSWAILKTHVPDEDVKASASHHLDLVGLLDWETRGRGTRPDNGAKKARAPLSGGRWRWLKISKQDELQAAATTDVGDSPQSR